MTEYATSADGTRIGYDREGAGPPVVLVAGAMQFRAFDPTTRELAHLLAGHGFDVVNYDRRGRGDSPADPPITLAQQVEDLAALVDVLTEGADDAVALVGNSSGAAIALAAAAAGLPVSRLVLFEAPLDEDEGPGGAEFLDGLRARIRAGDHDAAVEFFMRDMPPAWLAAAKAGEGWPVMTSIAPSLEADAEALAWTQSAPRADLWRGIRAKALVLVGSESLDLMHAAADSMVRALTDAERGTVEARDHRWEPRTLAMAIAAFLVD
ncbi:alpha/beta fold hydrolase [Agromyces sp. MMS24-JH15]|uniref:alpha/beta fold hydrolase n=1 Tax=Agromyces sp. MMS24-JH15 TaxID=3243765 RepID=UPI00374787F2